MMVSTEQLQKIVLCVLLAILNKNFKLFLMAELGNWAQSADLTPDTVKLLKKEGFTSLRLLRRLTPDLLAKNFQKRIPLAQYVALTAALEDLRLESSTVRQSERRESATSHEEEEGDHETLFQVLGKVVSNIKGIVKTTIFLQTIIFY